MKLVGRVLAPRDLIIALPPRENEGEPSGKSIPSAKIAPSECLLSRLALSTLVCFFLACLREQKFRLQRVFSPQKLLKIVVLSMTTFYGDFI